MKSIIFGVQSLSKSMMLILLKSSSLGLVVIDSISMPICNRFYGRLANIGQVTTFMSSYAGFLEPSGSRLEPLKSIRLMVKNPYASCFSLSVVNSAQFTLEMCLAAQNRQKIHKNPYFNVRSHTRSLLSVQIESPCTTFY